MLARAGRDGGFCDILASALPVHGVPSIFILTTTLGGRVKAEELNVAQGHYPLWPKGDLNLGLSVPGPTVIATITLHNITLPPKSSYTFLVP